MAFDPSLPAPHTPIVSAELRAQFNALKDLIDALSFSAIPIGAVVAWMKNLTGVPALPANFVECNGQTLSDGESPLDTQVIPDLNGGQSFLRGASASGGTGGSATHAHDVNLSGTSAGDPGASGGSTVPWGTYTTTDASTLPPYYEVVWVIRVK